MEQTRNSRVYYYMTLKCDLDLESGFLSRGFCTLSHGENIWVKFIQNKFKEFSK